MMKQTILISLACILGLLSSAYAQSPSHYAITWSLFGNGGSGAPPPRLTQTPYTIQDSIGQPFISVSSGDPFALNAGFWSGVVPIPYLVLIYVNGDNDLWQYMGDLVDKVQHGAAQSNAVILMVLDGPKFGDSHLYRVTKGAPCNLTVDPFCGGNYIDKTNVRHFAEDLAENTNLEDFFVEAIQSYSGAQQIVAAIIGHGGGWAPDVLAGQPPRIGGQPGSYGNPTELGGLLWDDHTENPGQGNSLSTPELGEALRNIQKRTTRKIDLLYLDACLMGMWEVAYELKDSVDLLLLSESWSWTTFAYDAHLRSLQEAQSIRELGERWIQNEVAVLCSEFTCELAPPYTYSLVELTAMYTFTSTLNHFADALTKVISETSATAQVNARKQIQQAFAQTDCFDSNQDYRIDGLDTYCDLYSFADQIKQRFPNSQLAAAAAAVQNDLSTQIVLAEQHHSGLLPPPYPAIRWTFSEHVKGLSIYLPLNLAAVQAKPDARYGWKLAYYHKISAAAAKWDEFLRAYWHGVPIPEQRCPDPCTVPPGPINPDGEWQHFLPLVMR
jgi:hypothetical protein